MALLSCGFITKLTTDNNHGSANDKELTVHAIIRVDSQKHIWSSEEKKKKKNTGDVVSSCCFYHILYVTPHPHYDPSGK